MCRWKEVSCNFGVPLWLSCSRGLRGLLYSQKDSQDSVSLPYDYESLELCATERLGQMLCCVKDETVASRAQLWMGASPCTD